MKHMIRKPMLALLLLAVMVCSTAFLTFFRSDIAAGWDQVDRLYSDTRITVELVPSGGWDEIQMKSHKDILIRNMPEVAETLTVMDCYYILRDGTPLPEPEAGMETVPMETDTIRGTNNITWLAEYWGLTIDWMDGWSPEAFNIEGGKAPCLIQVELLESAGLELGGTISVSPTPWYAEVFPQAPRIELTVVGTYEEPYGHTGEKDLLVPEESFLSGPKLFYNGYMMYRCYYRAYALRLNPVYNREYDRVEDELESFLYDMGAFTFASNARALENAVRPLIQKLAMQELLVLPLCVMLCAAALVVAVLLGMSFGTEVFLRLMWGEKRWAVFTALGGAVCLWLTVCIAAACGSSWLTAGAEWVKWAARYSGMTAAVSLLGCAAPLCRACGGNLVKSYQSREGE